VSDDPDAGQNWLPPRDRGTRKRFILAEIHRRQQDGQTLREIGAALGRDVVLATIIGWLWRIGEDSPADRA